MKGTLFNLTFNTEQIIKNSRTAFEDVDSELAKRLLEWVEDIIEVK